MADLRVIQPIHWTGTTKHDPNIMTCWACSTPEACAEANRCARARDEDYEHSFDLLGSRNRHLSGT